MKYIEELDNGDTFELDNNFYVLTSDFKKSGDRLSYSLQNGSPKWLSSQTIVEAVPLYFLDRDNNTVAIKIKNALT